MPAILKLPPSSNLRDPILQERMERGYCNRLQGFLASQNGEEVGLLLYEDWSDKKSGFIYEIFILPLFRKKGMGTLLLMYAEQHAIQLNCEIIRLKPYALAQEPGNILLKNWYGKNGYQQCMDDHEFMKKNLKTTTP